MLPLLRAGLASLALTGAVPVVLAQAQTSPPPETQPGKDRAEGRRNQKIENIHIEDRGASIDELRVGGQTQSITVTPKNNAPAYNVMPGEEDRQTQGKPDSSPADTQRVWWNIFKF